MQLIRSSAADTTISPQIRRRQSCKERYYFIINKTAGRKENYLDTDADVWGKIAVISTSREIIIFVFLQVTVMFLVASMDVSSVREHLYSPVASRETFAMV